MTFQVIQFNKDNCQITVSQSRGLNGASFDQTNCIVFKCIVLLNEKLADRQMNEESKYG